MNNFDFLKKDKKFDGFADIAITAENLYHIDTASCVFNVRRATEFAVKWMYSGYFNQYGGVQRHRW